MFKAIFNNQQAFEIEIKENNFYIDGQLFDLDIYQINENNFHILKESNSFKAEIITTDKTEKKFFIKINGNDYPIDIKDNSDILLNKLGINASLSNIALDVKAPMPGLILDIFISEGSEIKKGDPLLILEAMKMENILKSPRDGIVKSVTISKGKSVEKNQILIKF
ncbi:MAG TPA: acetyl-CoA carboxylase biotin carboxyl carrier protein subunit [Cytophagales bacterium]|nr:acetyl-CoA carboxylase biotin carboxyl carrier protein subunit [Cytophagales bacterium]